MLFAVCRVMIINNVWLVEKDTQHSEDKSKHGWIQEAYRLGQSVVCVRKFSSILNRQYGLVPILISKISQKYKMT